MYGIDLLGQGKSWPEDPTGLQFSAQLWASQVKPEGPVLSSKPRASVVSQRRQTEASG